MLGIYTRKMSFGRASDKLCFRSRTSGTVTIDQLVTEIANNNTTCTEADARAVIVNLKEITLKYLKMGMGVEMFLGTFFPCAKGTCESQDSDFSPSSSNNNHDIRLLFRPSPSIATEIRSETETGRVSNKYVTVPFIESVANALTGKETVEKGDSIILHGDYMKIDTSDSSQGLFLVQGDVETPLTYITRNADTALEARIGLDVSSGDYGVRLKNKKLKNLSVTNYEGTITIS